MNLNQKETSLVKDILAEVFGQKVIKLQTWKEQKAIDTEHIQELEEHINAIKALHEKISAGEVRKIKELFYTGRDVFGNKQTLLVSEEKVILSCRGGRESLLNTLRDDVIPAEFTYELKCDIADYNNGTTSLEVMLCTVNDTVRTKTDIKWEDPIIRYRTV